MNNNSFITTPSIFFCILFCYTDISPTELTINVQCGHTYHSKCILKWITKKRMCPQCRAPSSERDIKNVYCQDSLNYSFIEFCLQNYKNLQENTLTEVERDINKVVIQQLNSLYSKKFEELKDFTISITRRSFEYFELSNPNKIIEELKAKINKKFYVIKRMVENDVITIINQMDKGKTKNDTLKKKLSDLRLIHKHVMNENKNLNTIHSLAQKYKKTIEEQKELLKQEMRVNNKLKINIQGLNQKIHDTLVEYKKKFIQIKNYYETEIEGLQMKNENQRNKLITMDIEMKKFQKKCKKLRSGNVVLRKLINERKKCLCVNHHTKDVCLYNERINADEIRRQNYELLIKNQKLTKMINKMIIYRNINYHDHLIIFLFLIKIFILSLFIGEIISMVENSFKDPSR